MYFYLLKFRYYRLIRFFPLAHEVLHMDDRRLLGEIEHVIHNVL